MKANSSNPKKLWQSVSTILGNPANQSVNLSSSSASDFLAFLEQKVESIRTDTAGSAPPVFAPATCSFQVPTLIIYRSAAANRIYGIGGGGVVSAPENLSRRRLELFLIGGGGGGVHISKLT